MSELLEQFKTENPNIQVEIINKLLLELRFTIDSSDWDDSLWDTNELRQLSKNSSKICRVAQAMYECIEENTK